uniref:Uncharacterized protein n=1 Tax=Meloidogyne javanica TaxID=6303 RepID=A0A915MMR5_MELJA
MRHTSSLFFGQRLCLEELKTKNSVNSNERLIFSGHGNTVEIYRVYAQSADGDFDKFELLSTLDIFSNIKSSVQKMIWLENDELVLYWTVTVGNHYKYLLGMPFAIRRHRDWLISVGDDRALRVWTMDGLQIGEIYGHGARPFVLELFEREKMLISSRMGALINLRLPLSEVDDNFSGSEPNHLFEFGLNLNAFVVTKSKKFGNFSMLFTTDELRHFSVQQLCFDSQKNQWTLNPSTLISNKINSQLLIDDKEFRPDLFIYSQKAELVAVCSQNSLNILKDNLLGEDCGYLFSLEYTGKAFRTIGRDGNVKKWRLNFNEEVDKGKSSLELISFSKLNFEWPCEFIQNYRGRSLIAGFQNNYFVLFDETTNSIVCRKYLVGGGKRLWQLCTKNFLDNDQICGGGRSEVFCWELIFEEQNLQPQFNLLFSTELKNENNIDDIRVLCVRWIFGRRQFAVALCSDATISRFQLCSMAMFSSINLAGLIEESSQFLFSTTTSGYLFIFKLLILPNGTTKILIHEPYFVEKCGLSAISSEISPFNNHQHFILNGSESGSISILTFDSLLGNVENNIFVNLHASNITALKIWTSSIQDSTLLIASVALDCRLCIGNYIPNKNELIPQIQICLSISDPAALIVLPNRTSKELNEEEADKKGFNCIVSGSGIECINI